MGKTQVQNVAKEKDAILRYWRDSENGDGKYAKKRKCAYEDMNATVWDWFCDARSRNIGESRLALDEFRVRRLHRVEWMAGPMESPPQHPVFYSQWRECRCPRGRRERLGETSARHLRRL